MPYVCRYRSNLTGEVGQNCQFFECSDLAGFTLISSSYVDSCPRDLVHNQELQTAHENKIAVDAQYAAISENKKEVIIENEEIIIQIKLKKDIECINERDLKQEVVVSRSGYDSPGSIVYKAHSFPERLIDFHYEGDAPGFILTKLTRLNETSFAFTGTVGGTSNDSSIPWSYRIRAWLGGQFVPVDVSEKG